MKHIREGNFYNVEDEISNNPNASSNGLSKWQMEVRRQLINLLKRQNMPNADEVISKTFGSTLDKP